MKKLWGFNLALTLLVLSCSPAPRHTLTNNEKSADLAWVYSKFQENYAPLEYKQARYGFDFETLKKQYDEKALQTRTNEEFYSVLYKFVSEFKDAHTSGILSESYLPGRTFVGFLGFHGARKGDNYVITELFPSVQRFANRFPLKVGDVITKLDGVSLKEIALTTQVQTRDLGQNESNLTYHMDRIFNRYSLNGTLPTTSDAQLTVLRNEKEEMVQLSWVVKDLLVFLKEQREASQALFNNKTEKKTVYELALLNLTNEFPLQPFFAKKFLPQSKDYRFWNSFEFIDYSPIGLAKLLRNQKQGGWYPWENFRNDRNVPANALILSQSEAYPTYVTLEKVLNKDGTPAGQIKPVAYMYLDTFSPWFGDDAVVAEVKTTLNTLKANGVKDLVIDLINNGGGSLLLGIELAQLFSNQPLTLPQMQFALNETWLDDFENWSTNWPFDPEQVTIKKIYESLLEDRNSGKRLSKPWSTRFFMPASFTPNTDIEGKLNIVLLVNEMCASMCDIFTAMLKDNELVKVVGTKTMGAGGNVTTHFEAPNSHFSVNQTESLLLRKDGSYIENNGVEPDVAVAVNESVVEKYSPVRDKAVELLVKQQD